MINFSPSDLTEQIPERGTSRRLKPVPVKATVLCEAKGSLGHARAAQTTKELVLWDS